jgi:hypothetical protein
MKTNVIRKVLVIVFILFLLLSCLIPNVIGNNRIKNDFILSSKESLFFPSEVHIPLKTNRDINLNKIKENLVLNKKNCPPMLNNPLWQWAKSAGGTSQDEGLDIAVDKYGNTYITGYFDSTALFGSTVLTSQGEYDVFVGKLNNDGEWQWVKSAGGTELDLGVGIAVDTNCNVYITGFFEGSATFGNITLFSQGSDDVFVAKLNNDGEWQWAKSAGATGFYDTIGFGVATDRNGNCYITGFFEDMVTFGSIVLTSLGSEDMFIAKLDTNGEWQWAKNGGGTQADGGMSIAVDTTGNAYISGFFIGTAIFGDDTLIGQGGLDVFVTKINTYGEWQWAVGALTDLFQEIPHPPDVAVDGNGNVYITGNFKGTAIFGSTSFVSQGYSDIFIAKLNTNGEWQWAKSAGGIYYDSGQGIGVDGTGNTYVTGYFNDTVTFGTTTLTCKGEFDAFVIKLTSDGDWQWAVSAGGIKYCLGIGIAVDFVGNNYIIGNFWGNVMFGNITLESLGIYDVFVAKYGTSSENQPPNPPTITGPINGKVGTAYPYKFISTDPDGDEISYYIEWGDGDITPWTEFRPSGDPGYTESHSWATKGTYIIQAKAVDINGAESDWGSLEVTIPKNRVIKNPFLNILKQHPILYRLLQRIFG